MSERPFPPSMQRADIAAPAGASALMTLAVTAVIVVSLYFGREIFVPVALAILLSFALAPVVRWLRRLHLPNVPAVLLAVSCAFVAIGAFVYVLTWQIADLAQQLPAYQQNIEAKIDSFTEAPPGGRLFERAGGMLRDLGRKIEEEAEGEEDEAAPAGAALPEPEAEEQEPIPVEIHQPDPTPTQLLRSIVGPLIGPLATAGIVIVFVIFLLLKREDLRDRFIRLAGAGDLSRTTQALDDAARRVGRYLLTQLAVNLTYGIPIGIGLWLIGLPNPILWGMLATVLRFVPYIGPIIAAFFPLALAVAVDPSWTTLMWTGGLIVLIELISNNAVEPWLYGASTGLSPVAIILAAIFWTWLWGPIGLLLSTPLTVCLVVLGRHVPQLAFLDVLLGNEPVLTPAESLYQKLLMGAPDDATEAAEKYIQEHSLTRFYDEVAIAALAQAEADRARGVLDEDRRDRVAESAMLLIDNLAEYEEAEPAREAVAAAEEGEAEATPPAAIADDRLVLCAAARGNLDEAAAAMLAQILEARGANVRVLPFQSLQTVRLRELDVGPVGAVVLSYMNADSLAHARLLVRRIRRRIPGVPVIVGFWTFTPEDMARRDPLGSTGADRVPTSLSDAVDDVLEAFGEAPGEARTIVAATAEAASPGAGQAGSAAASSSSISPSMTDKPIRQKPGSLASSPKG